MEAIDMCELCYMAWYKTGAPAASWGRFPSAKPEVRQVASRLLLQTFTFTHYHCLPFPHA
jgi:hypothetical protein